MGAVRAKSAAAHGLAESLVGKLDPLLALCVLRRSLPRTSGLKVERETVEEWVDDIEL
jgi:hypothetical protein